ncbi:hypothetical protein DdX_15493 [Ditylenchus destructor]|uniref:Uncharacterized protein n=1 Tax=Ditylenchus destructor TaxID=166010 RepID=A0AAD4MS37_9BILA|nr:hypothetical protein DdX_15493 [Ditylenchus destructor]
MNFCGKWLPNHQFVGFLILSLYFPQFDCSLDYCADAPSPSARIYCEQLYKWDSEVRKLTEDDTTIVDSQQNVVNKGPDSDFERSDLASSQKEANSLHQNTSTSVLSSHFLLYLCSAFCVLVFLL